MSISAGCYSNTNQGYFTSVSGGTGNHSTWTDGAILGGYGEVDTHGGSADRRQPQEPAHRHDRRCLERSRPSDVRIVIEGGTSASGPPAKRAAQLATSTQQVFVAGIVWQAVLLAVFEKPPRTVAPRIEAVFDSPPVTDAWPALAVLNAPPDTVSASTDARF